MWPQPNEISLIIPHYDRPHHLDLTLKGIERNTEHPKEVIIVEMGIHELALEKYDLNIKIIAHYQNRDQVGFATARNKGAEFATGDILAFLDVDCIPEKDYFKEIKRICSQREGLFMAHSQYLLQAVTGLDKLQENSVSHPDKDFPEAIELCEDYTKFSTLGFFLKKDLYENIGGFDNYYTGYGMEDIDFALATKNRLCPFYLTTLRVYHQQHSFYHPPLNHLESIVKNSNYFKSKWRQWPMVNYLEEFKDKGYIDWSTQHLNISQLKCPSPEEIEKTLIENEPFI